MFAQHLKRFICLLYEPMRALERVNAMITLRCPPKLGLRIYHGPIRYTKVLKQKLTLLISFQEILKVTQHLRDMLTLLGRGEVRCCIGGGGESANFP